MIGDMLVVDAVVHAYNWIEPNWRSPLAAGFSAGAYGFHHLLTRDDAYRMTPDEFNRDWSVEDLEHTLFTESDVDLASFHTTPLHDYYLDGLVSLDKGVEFKGRNPARTVLYGNINPLEGHKALEDMERQVKELGASGIKLYPARYYEGRTLPERLDDPRFGIPMVEKAIELGVRSIAVHKAIPFGPTQSTYYHVDDFDEVAARFPQMNFEVVHAGFAFLEETCFLLGRFPNVYVNLEATSGLVINSPRKFAEAIGNFLYWGGEDRILFASGCTFVHPQPYIEELLKFEMPEDLIEGYGLPPISEVAKRKMLGENFLRLHGLDPEEVRRQIAGDRWAQHGGRRNVPWSAVRGGAAATAAGPGGAPAGRRAAARAPARAPAPKAKAQRRLPGTRRAGRARR